MVATNDTGLKRYNLVLPASLYAKLDEQADRQQTTVVDLIRKYLRLGLAITTLVEDDPDAALIVRSGDVERELVIL